MSRRRGDRRITVGADTASDTRDHVAELRRLGMTPHVAQFATGLRRRSAIDRRTTRHPGYAISQRTRKQGEQAWCAETWNAAQECQVATWSVRPWRHVSPPSEKRQKAIEVAVLRDQRDAALSAG